MAREQQYDGYGVEYLLSVARPLVLTGKTRWNRRASRTRARWLLDAGHSDFDFYLHIWILDEAPSVFTVGLRIDSDQLNIRVDVRQDHTPNEGHHIRGTHVHDIRRSPDVFRPPEPPFWPALSDDRVSPGEYFEALRAFCNYLQIRMQSFSWVHPDLGEVEGDE